MNPIRRIGWSIGGAFAFVFVFAFVGLVSSCAITLGIWPGQIKLLAPIFCSDAQPDPFVVADSYSPRPGETVTNFTLYCMGPRGDATDHGFIGPFLAVSVLNGIVLTLVGGAFAYWIRRSTRRTVRAVITDQFGPHDATSALHENLFGAPDADPFGMSHDSSESSRGPFVD